MADIRDDSLIFSLRGREDGRLLDEALRRERARLAEEHEYKRRLNILEAARLAELRQREEWARIEALRVASVERARIEAESRARLELLEKQQEHERRLLLIREEANTRRMRHLALSGFSAAALMFVLSVGIYFGKFRPESIRLQRAYDDLVSAERNRADETRRLLERTEKRRVETQSELDDAKARLAALEKTSSAEDGEAPKSAAGSRGSSGADAKPK